jgi:hypothetical protein
MRRRLSASALIALAALLALAPAVLAGVEWTRRIAPAGNSWS